MDRLLGLAYVNLFKRKQSAKSNTIASSKWMFLITSAFGNEHSLLIHIQVSETFLEISIFGAANEVKVKVLTTYLWSCVSARERMLLSHWGNVYSSVKSCVRHTSTTPASPLSIMYCPSRLSVCDWKLQYVKSCISHISSHISWLMIFSLK